MPEYDRPQCEHVKLDGVRCGSPALKGKPLCYFHHRVHQRHETWIPFLEDGNSIQYALMQIMRGIMDNKLDLKKASLLLYALQIATINLKRVHTEPYWERVVLQDPIERALLKYARELRKASKKPAVSQPAPTASATESA